MSDMVAREWAIFGGAMGGSLDKDSGNTVLDDVAKSASIVRPGNVLNFLGVPSVTVVIPAKNEALNLPHVLPKIPSWVAEVILVDGKSTDRTVEVARSLRPDIKVVGQDRPGKGAALRAGFAAATGDIIVMLDADGSTDPAEIPGFVGALLAGADFVKGSRFLQGGGTRDMEWYRRFGNWGFVKLVQLRFGGKFTDLCYGYNAFWRDVLDRLSLEQDDGFEIETSMNVQALRARLVVKEVASTEHRRIHGKSNLRTIPDGWRVLSTIVRMGTQRRPEQGAGTPPRVLLDVTAGPSRKAAGN